ncbi:MAG: RIP metalloprotease RseP [Candidatus Cloacimonetes bacterium]|nr:RIP metalloprotease RseP [Candidatus Cloacimonadota bacterium]
MISIIIAVFVLGLLVAVHEGGHFIAAKMMGVEVEKFSIGFGPKLVAFSKNGTEYRISLIPLGGYLKMKDENPGEEITGSSEDGSFQTKKWYQRAFIAVAGPLANFIFAIFILFISFWVGKSYPDQAPIVGKINEKFAQYLHLNDEIIQINDNDVIGWSQIIQNTSDEKDDQLVIIRNNEKIDLIIPNLQKNDWTNEILPKLDAVVGEASVGFPAYQAGILPEDIILAIDENKVKDWYEMHELIANSTKDKLTFEIQRGDNVFSKSIKLQKNMLDDRNIIGINPKISVHIEEKYNMLESAKYGAISAVNFVHLYYVMLGKLILEPSELKNSIGGPVMLFSMSKQTATRGLSDILGFIGAISLILMVMNLLPIPILDGGQIFFCFIEGIMRKPLSLKIQLALQNIGFILLMSLMIFAFWNDFTRIFERNHSIKKQETEQMIEDLIKD